MSISKSPVELSAVVVAQNVASIIGRCIESLQFADEIVVVDAESADGTADIARDLGARVISHRWPGFAAQKRFAMIRARGEWVFFCDSDEEVTPALAREIRDIVGRKNDPGDGGGGFSGYFVSRRNQFLGRWVRHGPWARDRQLRLFRRGRGTVTARSVHEGVAVDGPVGVLVGELNHYAHPTLSQSIARLNRYTTLEARDRAHRRRVGVIDVFIPPLGVFFNYYLVKGCWREGLHGFLLSAITAMYKSVLYFKIFELRRSAAQSGAAMNPPV